MNKLSRRVKQDIFFDEVTTNKISKGYYLLKGESGTGKTYNLEKILNKFESLRWKTICINFENCEESEDFLKNKSINLSKQKSTDYGKVLKKTVISSIIGLNDFLGNLLSSIDETYEIFKKKESRYLEEDEVEIFIKLEKYFSKENNIIVFDSIEQIDETSLKFLRKFFIKEVIDLFPFLKNTMIIFSLNNIEYSFSLEDLNISQNNFKEFKLNLLSYEDTSLALETFNFKNVNVIDDYSKKILYKCSGGNIGFFKDYSEYYSSFSNRNPNDFPEEIDKRNISKSLDNRLNKTPNGKNISDVLKKLSIVENDFSYKKIEKYLQEVNLKKIEPEHILDLASRKNPLIHLVAKNEGDSRDNVYMYSYEEIREAFLNLITDKKKEYYKKFADNLQEVSAGDYISRFKYMEKSGNENEAKILQILCILAEYRKNIFDVDILYLYELEGENKEYLNSMEKAYKLFYSENYKFALQEIHKNYNTYLDERLIGEKLYLKAIIISKLLEEHSMVGCIYDLEENFEKISSIEYELGYRLSSILFLFYLNTEDNKKARKIYKEITEILKKKRSFDPNIQRLISILDRKSGLFDEIETAILRGEKSVDFFSSEEQLNINPSEYYMSLCNYSANLFVGGRFKESYENANKALELSEKYPEIKFIRKEIPLNNRFISSFYLAINNNLSDESILLNFIEGKEIADKIILLNNIAVILAYKEQLLESLNLFKKIEDEMINKNIKDDYYNYFCYTNFAMVNYIVGDIDSANKCLEKIDNACPSIISSTTLNPILIRRASLLREIIQENKLKSLKRIDEKLQHIEYIGPSWRTFGRALIMSDLQFISES